MSENYVEGAVSLERAVATVELHRLARSYGVDVLVDPVDQQWVAGYLGVRYATLRANRTRGGGVWGDFPEPAVAYGNALVWERAEVEAWQRRHKSVASDGEIV